MELLHHGIALKFEGLFFVKGLLEFLREGGLGGFEFDEFLGGGLGCTDGLLGLGLFGVADGLQLLDSFVSFVEVNGNGVKSEGFLVQLSFELA